MFELVFPLMAGLGTAGANTGLALIILGFPLLLFAPATALVLLRLNH